MSTLPTRHEPTHIVRAGGGPPRGPVRPAQGGGLNGRDVVRILRKRKWLIVIAISVCIALSAVAHVLWAQYAPLYTASATLELSSRMGSALDAGGTLAGEAMDRALTSTARMASWRPVAQDAVDYTASPETRDLRQTDWFNKDVDTAVDRLQEEIIASPIPKTNQILIRMTGRNPKEMAVIVNAYASAVVRLHNTQRIQGLDSELQQVTQESNRLVGEVEALRQKAQPQNLANTPQVTRIAELESQLNLGNIALQTLAKQVADLETIMRQVQSGWDSVKDLEPKDLMMLPEVINAVEADPTYMRMKNQMVSLETEKENAVAHMGQNHPTVAALQARMDSLEKQMQDYAGELQAKQAYMLRQSRESAPNAISQEILAVRMAENRAKKNVEDIVKELAVARQEFQGLRDRVMQDQNQANRDVIAKIAQLERLNGRLLELQLERRNLQDLKRSQAAFPPTEPSWPKWTIMIPLGVFVGLVVGLGLAFLLELIDATVKSPSDVSRRVDLPLLGMVPHPEDIEEEIEDIRLAFATNPDTLISEAYRQIRTCLLFSGPAEQRRSMLITSPLPGDGRTAVALNLAACMARGGRRVLVVDANFRQPVMGELFAEAPEAGLSSALIGQVDWRDQVHEVEENFCVMAAGPQPPNPTELLGTERMREIVQEMEDEYDQVIFDGAPCVVVTDAAVLGTQVDGVLIVIRAGVNTHGIVQRTRDILNRVGAHVLGVVLNGVRVTAGGYLRKNYETFYEYSQKAQLPAAVAVEPDGQEAAPEEPDEQG